LVLLFKIWRVGVGVKVPGQRLAGIGVTVIYFSFEKSYNNKGYNSKKYYYFRFTRLNRGWQECDTSWNRIVYSLIRINYYWKNIIYIMMMNAVDVSQSHNKQVIEFDFNGATGTNKMYWCTSWRLDNYIRRYIMTSQTQLQVT